jgi:hypothetical protein
MNAFLRTMIVLNGLSVLVRMFCLINEDYPRPRHEVHMGEDIVDLLIGMGFILWALKVMQ